MAATQDDDDEKTKRVVLGEWRIDRGQQSAIVPCMPFLYSIV